MQARSGDAGAAHVQPTQGCDARLIGTLNGVLGQRGLELGMTFERRPDALAVDGRRMAPYAAHEAGKPEHAAGNAAAIDRDGSAIFPGPFRVVSTVRRFTTAVLDLPPDSDARRVAQSSNSQVRYTCRVAHINFLGEQPYCYAKDSLPLTIWLPAGKRSYALALPSARAEDKFLSSYFMRKITISSLAKKRSDTVDKLAIRDRADGSISRSSSQQVSSAKCQSTPTIPLRNLYTDSQVFESIAKLVERGGELMPEERSYRMHAYRDHGR